jgi:anti-sigma factor RsiW
MNHHDLREKLSAYMDGEVSPEERSAISEHLEICKECRDAIEDLRKTVAHVKTLEKVEPPAWMTQKIMAQVRSKAESRKSIWQSLFFPLHIKLPLEAVTALFCVVIGYYVYQSVQPAVKFAGAPVQYEQSPVARKQAAPSPPPAPQSVAEPGAAGQPQTAVVRQAVKEEAKVQAPAAKTEAEQPAAGYREKKSTAAAVPAQTQVERRSAETAGAQTAANQVEAARDAATRSEVRTKTAARPAGALAVAEAPASGVTLVVSDLEKAAAEIKDRIGQAGGKIAGTESVSNGIVISATIPPARLQELMDRLDQLGKIREKNLPPVQPHAPVAIRITITPQPPEP